MCGGRRGAGAPHKAVLFGKAGAGHRGADRRPFILQPGLGLKTLFLKWDGAPGPVSSSPPLPGGPAGAGGPGVSRYLGCRWARQALGEGAPELHQGDSPGRSLC